MINKTILISAASGDIGYSAIKALYGSVERIIGCDMKDYSPAQEMLNAFYSCPPVLETEKYLSTIKEIINQENVDYFLPVNELELEFLNTQRDFFEKQGVDLLMNNEGIINICLDKEKTATHLKDIGIKTPKTEALSRYSGAFGYPVIVKLRKGCGGKFLMKVEDDHDLEYARHKDNGSYIAQEYIGSEKEDYTTGIFSDGKTTSSISFRRDLGYGGLSIKADLVYEPFLEELAQKVSNAMKLVGSINIQCRREGDIFVPYEINPRLSSTLLFRKKFGFNDALWWLETMEGKPHTYTKTFQSGTAARVLSESYYNMKDIE